MLETSKVITAPISLFNLEELNYEISENVIRDPRIKKVEKLCRQSRSIYREIQRIDEQIIELEYRQQGVSGVDLSSNIGVKNEHNYDASLKFYDYMDRLDYLRKKKDYYAHFLYCIKTLVGKSERNRKCLIEGMSYRSMAEELGVSVNCLRKRVCNSILLNLDTNLLADAEAILKMINQLRNEEIARLYSEEA